ncbi:RNase P/RNase MRP complex subunit [Coemansia sp. RSA 1813]|nr:RNase P/RNase MRP complex subunit [Coemansia sp. RSA 1646]KAJ1770320.1 RNase P/RNase MRP complex subunit [Coemansia sp. RSA 1843]KAJ2091665.1 RNase P/RNase MRP complex subunit [Coemansia sp. RSA 986]KAJ2216933.1 RNase P/RNase MRP complex subunit [Coemansia sp. RSA 487]KAJ2571936.1 RNase P/RNase MRP complex subunit [Coemansia sp. RSA 1813]
MGGAGGSDIDFYTPLNEQTKARSGAPMDVPVNPTTRQFTEGFIDRTVDTNVSDVRAQAAYKGRVEGRMVLLTNPFKDKQSKSDRRVGSDSKLSKRSNRKTITSKEKRAFKIYDIPKEAQRYELFLPLHKLWSQYITSLTGDKPIEKVMKDRKQCQNILSRLLKADMHGAIVSVDKAKCPNYIGIKGIVAQETKNVFKIITLDNRLVTVPKAHNVFTLELQTGVQCQIYGSQFAYRASERASRKFKPKPTIDL